MDYAKFFICRVATEDWTKLLIGRAAAAGGWLEPLCRGILVEGTAAVAGQGTLLEGP